jgi:segregation and condensation protein B
LEDKEAKAVLEAMLFIAGEPLGLDALKKLVELDKPRMDQLLKELVNEYSLRNAGILIVEVAEGYQMVTNPACSPYVRKLISTAVPKRLSPSSLETIAIIAYKQPIIKAEIEAIRGVNSDGVIKTLLERRLIKILGRKEAPGRPLMYGTTHEFLQYFGLKDLSELPTLKELNEIDIPELPEELPDDPGEQGGEAVPETPDAGPEKRPVQDESLEASPEDENPPLNSHSEEEQDNKAVKD